MSAVDQTLLKTFGFTNLTQVSKVEVKKAELTLWDLEQIRKSLALSYLENKRARVLLAEADAKFLSAQGAAFNALSQIEEQMKTLQEKMNLSPNLTQFLTIESDEQEGA